jgi:hypothetical protein
MKTRFGFFLSIAIAFGIASVFSATTQAQDFKVCKSTFALCRIAPCDPIPRNDKQVACHCTVNNSYSAGQEACTGVKDTSEGQQIRSRYYSVHSYAICSNDRPGHGVSISPALSIKTIRKQLRALVTS